MTSGGATCRCEAAADPGQPDCDDPGVASLDRRLCSECLARVTRAAMSAGLVVALLVDEH